VVLCAIRMKWHGFRFHITSLCGQYIICSDYRNLESTELGYPVLVKISYQASKESVNRFRLKFLHTEQALPESGCTF
jgi:hypothetical protein